jgi:hypothetical protein
MNKKVAGGDGAEVGAGRDESTSVEETFGAHAKLDAPHDCFLAIARVGR